jgi:hypothetical protein
MESAFEGPLVTIPPQPPYATDPVTWVDVVAFAKANPNEFALTSSSDRERVCRFFLKGVQVEVTEDDWRLIMSGALDGFRVGSSQPLEEDEAAELATVEILEQRMQVVIKKADEIAKRARQLNYNLSGRKAAINARRKPQQGHGVGFQAVNQPQRSTGVYDIHADLLQQFTTQQRSSHSRASSTTAASQPSMSNPSMAGPTPQPQSQTPRVVPSTNSRPSSATNQEATTQYEPLSDPAATHRPLIAARLEKLERGGTIYPPCDRCRRLKVQCVKHLTACQGCTKKHAKCSWKTVTEDEAVWLKRETVVRRDVVGPHEDSDVPDSRPARPSSSQERRGDESGQSRYADGARSPAGMREDYRSRAFEPDGLPAWTRAEGLMDLDGTAATPPQKERDLRERERERDTGPPIRSSSSAPMVTSLLSHMASVASSRADMRDGSNTPTYPPRH